MNTPTKFEAPGSARPQCFRIAAAALGLFLALLAVAVKTLHYTGHSAEIRYFSSSVKIVKAGPKEFGPTVPVTVVAIEVPKVIAAATVPNDFAQFYQREISPARAPHIRQHLLRGPPPIA